MVYEGGLPDMAESKEAYVDNIAAKIHAFEGQVDKLLAKAREAEGEQRKNYEQAAKEIQEQIEDLKTRLDKVRDAGGDAWHEFRAGIEDATSEIKQALAGDIRGTA
jgi:septation ring formation regulator EzrA